MSCFGLECHILVLNGMFCSCDKILKYQVTLYYSILFVEFTGNKAFTVRQCNLLFFSLKLDSLQLYHILFNGKFCLS